MAKALLVDTSMCLGCNACSVECKRNNHVPVGRRIAWTRIRQSEVGAYPNVRLYYIKRACNHCSDAACQKACPVGAVSKPDGAHVVVNRQKCIQCGYCRMACPFETPHYGEPRGPSQKCSFCYGTRSEGEPTACAAACPFGAITFGEREALLERGLSRVSALKHKGFGNANLYGLNEMGGTHVLYALGDSPEAYGLPADAQVPAIVTAWKDMIQPIGWAVAGAVIVGLGANYIVSRANAIKAREKKEKSEAARETGPPVEKYRPRTRILHWTHTVAFVLLFLTGLILFVPVLGSLAGAGITRIVHRVAAGLFVAGPIVYLLFNWRASWHGIREAFAWSREDIGWLKAAPRYYFLADESVMPPQAEINTGQKMWWFLVIVLGIVFVVTGGVMWFAVDAVPAALLRWMVVIHDVAFIVIGAMFLVHIYLAVFHPMMTESWNAMAGGKISADYAESHHGKWYEQISKGMSQEEARPNDKDSP